MNTFSLKCFGVGDGLPCANRKHSASLYRLANTTILIDCGEPLADSYQAAGLDFDAIDRIFISHLHPDHVAGFFMLMQGFWLERRKKDLPVHLPADGIQPLREMLNAMFLFDELFPFRPAFTPILAGEPVTFREVSVPPFRSSHLDRLRASFQQQHPQDFAAYCFLIESDQLRVGHSADIGKPEDLSPLLENPLDFLVCELAHFEPEELFRYLQGCPIKRIVFTHLGWKWWNDLEGTRRLATRLLPDIPFSFAQDGEEITL